VKIRSTEDQKAHRRKMFLAPNTHWNRL